MSLSVTKHGFESLKNKLGIHSMYGAKAHLKEIKRTGWNVSGIHDHETIYLKDDFKYIFAANRFITVQPLKEHNNAV